MSKKNNIRIFTAAIFILASFFVYNNYLKKDVLFIGDSLTRQADWDKLLADDRIINLGKDGETIKALLKRKFFLFPPRARKIFLMIGINDLVHSRKPAEIAHDYRSLLLKLLHKYPHATFYIQSVLPIYPSSYKFPFTNEDIIALNSQIALICEELGLNYIDLFPYFIKDGQLNKNYSNDGIHLNDNGYVCWKNLIRY